MVAGRLRAADVFRIGHGRGEIPLVIVHIKLQQTIVGGQGLTHGPLGDKISLTVVSHIRIESVLIAPHHVTAIILIRLRDDTAVRIFLSGDVGVFHRNGIAAFALIDLNILITVRSMDSLIHIASLLHTGVCDSAHIVIGVPLFDAVLQLLIGHHAVFIIGLGCILL